MTEGRKDLVSCIHLNSEKSIPFFFCRETENRLFEEKGVKGRTV